ncbi:MAG TPA: hypothetical protein VFE05_10625 [Longimicrobiaceae bacterium]|jgi:hypothetical protein|nr:hypothetical protein [Longimicrobiaceae bacterium]
MKEFDAVAMTRRIRDSHYELLKDATPEERIRFYQQGAERVRRDFTRPKEQPGGTPRG